MISLEDALRIRNERCATLDAPIGEFLERSTFWWLDSPVHHVGGQGVIIDKVDGHVRWLGTGAGLRLEDWFFIHGLGFRHTTYSCQILNIRDEQQTLQILRDTMEFRQIPALDIQIDWRTYRFLPQLILADCFDSRLVATGCEEKDCPAVGTVILESTDSKKIGEYERNIGSCFAFPEKALLTSRDVERMLDSSAKKRFEDALSRGMLRELAEQMGHEGLSQVAIHHLYALFYQFLKDTGREVDASDLSGCLFYIEGGSEPSARWFKDHLTNYEIVKYRKAAGCVAESSIPRAGLSPG